MLGILLYELHRDAVDYNSGIRAHLDAVLVMLACTGATGLGSKVGQVYITFAVAISLQ